MILLLALLLRYCTIAANVEDLPLPVGPVTTISPLGFMIKSLQIRGNPNSSIVGILKGIILKTMLKEPLCRCTLTRNLATPAIEYEKSTSLCA